MKIGRKDFVSEMAIFLFFIGIVAVIVFFQYFNRMEINNAGVYTKYKIINSEGYKGGILITIEYYFKTKKHIGRFAGDLGKSAIGNQYFIKVLSNREDAFVFLRDHLVPDCLLDIAAPPDGWKELPMCK